MDGSSRAVGSPAPIRIMIKPPETEVEIVDGEEVTRETAPPEYKTYLMDPVDVDTLGTIENHLLAMRKSPEDILKPLLGSLENPAHQEMALQIAYKDLKRGYNKVSNKEIAEFVDTHEGIVMTLWLCLRRNHPEIDSIEAAQALYAAMTATDQAEIVRRRNLASGTDLLGNSTGRTEPKSSGSESSAPAPAPAPKPNIPSRPFVPGQRTPPRRG